MERLPISLQTPDGPFVESPFSSDRAFDHTYPDWIGRLSEIHWTPVEMAQQAARFLVTEPGTRVLDIGCGPGKFCAVGAAVTSGHFTGIEYRESLVSIANQTIQELGLSGRVQVILGNIVEIDFSSYEAFYFYNPFYENVMPYLRIDSTVELNRALYTFYMNHVMDQLAQAPLGTRLATYHGDPDEIPNCYRCEHESPNGFLKLWVKTVLEPDGTRPRIRASGHCNTFGAHVGPVGSSAPEIRVGHK